MTNTALRRLKNILTAILICTAILCCFPRPMKAYAASKTFNISIGLSKNASKKASQKTVQLAKGHKIILTGVNGEKKLTGKKLKYTSNKKDVATVNKKGIITAKKNGKAKITITTKNGKKKAILTVKVVKKVEITSLTIDKSSLNLKKGESATITSKVAPETASDPSVSWSSSDEGVAIVSGGTVTAKGVGKCMITAAAGEKAVICNVTVTPEDASGGGQDDKPDDTPVIPDDSSSGKVSSVKLDKHQMILLPDTKNTLSATVLPEDANNRNYLFSTSNSTVATVSGKGVVTAKASGKAIITCTAFDGSGCKDSCVVEVKSESDSVKTGNYNSDTTRSSKYCLVPNGEDQAGHTTYSLFILGTAPVEGNSQEWRGNDYRNYITEIIIKEGVTTIGYSAFTRLPALREVSIPDTVKEIGKDTFYYCSELSSVRLGSGLEYIGESAFAYCPIRSLTIPASVQTIYDYAFQHCKISTLNFEKSSKPLSISKFAFYSNYIMGELNLPARLTGLNNYAFADNYITSLTFESGSKLPSIGDGAFMNNSLTGELTIPASVTSVGNNAFEDNNITSLTFESGSILEQIGNHAFEGNKQLSGTIRFPDSLKYIQSFAFKDCCNDSLTTGIEAISFGSGSKLSLISVKAFYLTNTLKVVTLPAGATVNDKAFYQEGGRIPSVCRLSQINYRGDENSYKNQLCSNLSNIDENNGIKVSSLNPNKSRAGVNITYNYTGD